MPPKLTPPTDPSQAADLVPHPDTLKPDATGATFAGLKVRAAKTLSQDAFSALFYAYPGVGKTTIAGMFADYEAARDVLVVDAEGGATVLAHRDYVDVVEVATWQEADKVLTYLQRAKLEDLPYRTVVFDNVTELAGMQMKSMVGNSPPEIQHYNRNLMALMEFTRKVRDLSRFRGLNTVLVGWQESKEDKDTGRSRQVVALSNKLSDRLPGVVNIVGHLTVLDNAPLYTRRLSFAATPKNDAKFRRAVGGVADPIPDDIYYGLHDTPIADILRTLYEGVPFPADKYKRPTRRDAQQVKIEDVTPTT